MAFKIENIPSQKKKEKGNGLDGLLKTEIHLFGASFNSKKKETFYVEIGILLDAGVSLRDSLVLVAEDQKKQNDKDLLKGIVDAIILGKSFSEAILANKVFSEYEYYSLKIGEETGTLKKVCKELGNYFMRRNEQRKNIVNALSYPIVVFSTALLAVLFMLRFVVPMFSEIFKQNNVELPGLTKGVIAISEGFQDNFTFIVILCVLFLIGIKLVSKKVWFQKYSSLVLLKTPFVGELLRKMYMGQFTQATSLLVSAKVPMLNSIQLTKKMIDFYPMKEALQNVENQLLTGGLLSASFAENSIFDPKMISLIKVAEETNQNEFIFNRLTEQYNQEVQHQSKTLSTVLEPLIIIFLGAIVALVLIAMYMPMFQLSSVIG